METSKYQELLDKYGTYDFKKLEDYISLVTSKPITKDDIDFFKDVISKAHFPENSIESDYYYHEFLDNGGLYIAAILLAELIRLRG